MDYCIKTILRHVFDFYQIVLTNLYFSNYHAPRQYKI